MTGLDDEDDGFDDFRPAPHPDDRLWRHPSEMAAFLAAQAAENATADDSDDDAGDPGADITIELPAVATAATPIVLAPADPPARPGRPDRQPSRVHRGLIAAAAAVAVGATALTVGALSARSDSPTEAQFATEAVAMRSESTRSSSPADDASDDAAATPPDAQGTGVGSVSAFVDPEAEAALASRLHEELANSLPRIQAASPDGMVEGSGLFITEQGHIATSASLVANSDYVLAWTHDGQRLQASVVAVDWFSDVAILQVETPSAPVAMFSADTSLWSGQYAMAIDYEHASMTLGKVASLTAAQPVNILGDASSRVRIEPGALPGSAIIDDTGAVIAMVNLGPDGDSDQLHATPAWMIERVVEELLTHGVAVHPWLGVQVTALGNGVQVQIAQVVPGSPADHAGLRVGDLIDAVDGDSISTTMSLWTLVQLHEPGDYVDLAVTRNGERRLISAHLEALVN